LLLSWGKFGHFFILKKLKKKTHITQIYTLKKFQKLPNFFVKKLAKFHQEKKEEA
jgi:hypothetical protein